MDRMCRDILYLAILLCVACGGSGFLEDCSVETQADDCYSGYACAPREDARTAADPDKNAEHPICLRSCAVLGCLSAQYCDEAMGVCRFGKDPAAPAEGPVTQ